MTKKCGARLCIPNLTRHFFVILPSCVFQPSCCVSSLVIRVHTTLLASMCHAMPFSYKLQCFGFFHGCTIANVNVRILPQNDYNLAWIFSVTEQLKLYFRQWKFNVSLDSEFLWSLFLVVIANQKHSLWAITQSDCEKVICNANFFYVSRSRSRLKNTFVDVDIVAKNKSNVV